MADPGPDRTVYLNEPVILDGSNSTGNGGIFNYTWTVQGLEVQLFGPLVSISFNETGTYNVTLSVLDQLGLQGVGIISITVVEKYVPAPELTLVVGPVKDEYMKIIVGAEITISWNGTEYTNTTVVDGTATFNLPVGVLNNSVSIRIVAEGYYDMEFDRLVTPEGRLDGELPLLDLIEPDVEEENDNDFPAWIILIILLFAALFLGAILIVIRMKTKVEDENEE